MHIKTACRYIDIMDTYINELVERQPTEQGQIDVIKYFFP